MSESKYNDAWKKGFDSGVESQRLSCIYECTKDYDEYESGYQKGRADEREHILEILNGIDRQIEHLVIVVLASECNEELKEQKHERNKI